MRERKSLGGGLLDKMTMFSVIPTSGTPRVEGGVSDMGLAGSTGARDMGSL